MNVPTFVPPPCAEAGPEPILFLMDEQNYVVAEDFMVDVPQFNHEPSWFQPARGRAAG